MKGKLESIRLVTMLCIGIAGTVLGVWLTFSNNKEVEEPLSTVTEEPSTPPITTPTPETPPEIYTEPVEPIYETPTHDKTAPSESQAIVIEQEYRQAMKEGDWKKGLSVLDEAYQAYVLEDSVLYTLLEEVGLMIQMDLATYENQSVDHYMVGYEAKEILDTFHDKENLFWAYMKANEKNKYILTENFESPLLFETDNQITGLTPFTAIPIPPQVLATYSDTKVLYEARFTYKDTSWKVWMREKENGQVRVNQLFDESGVYPAYTITQWQQLGYLKPIHELFRN